MKLFRDYKFIDVICSAVAVILATAFGSVFIYSQALPAEASSGYHLAQLETLNKVAEDSGLVPENSTQAEHPLSEFLGRIISPILGITGSLFFILIVYAGIMWMTAAGNEERVGKAKKILSTAFMGLLLVIMAYTITRFVLSRIISSTDPDQSSSGVGVCFISTTNGNCETDMDCFENLRDDCLSQGGNWAPNSTCQEACSLQ